MILGIGSHPTAASVSVRWPSGKTMTVKEVPEGTLLVAYENPADSPSGEAFTRQPYRIKQKAPPTTAPNPGPVFPMRAVDAAAKPARLRVYTTFTTSSPSSISALPVLRRVKEELSAEGLDMIAVPIDETDDNSKLAAYNKQWKPSWRLVNVPPARRAEAIAAYAKALGEEPPLPSTVVTDDAGHILIAQPGVPSISELRQMLGRDH
jgi:hypothetical protein